MAGKSEALATGAAKLDIVPLSRDRYREWDLFCAESDEAWFWHTSHWLEYTLNYRPELKPASESFLCQQEGRVLAICPLIVETQAAGMNAEFSYGGDCGPAPAFCNGLSQRARKDLTRAVFQHLDSLAEELRVQRASFRMSPLAPDFWKSAVPQPNPLTKLGFADISQASHVIDLCPDPQSLLRDMRKGHRADITRAEKLLDAQVLDQQSITQDAFERYRMLHHKAAGRVTRPLITFEMMHHWIQQGLAVLAVASLQGKDVGFALISVYKDGAYYSSSCEDPEYKHLPIGHIMQWRVLQWLKEHGFRRYEIGLQIWGNQPHAMVSEKEMKIAFFKRGFGGAAVPFWRAEKFYSREYYLRVASQRMRDYAESVAQPSQHQEAGRIEISNPEVSP